MENTNVMSDAELVRSLKQANENLTKENNLLRQDLKSQNELISTLKDQLKKTNELNQGLQQTVANLNETLREIERRFFGTSSEKTSGTGRSSKKNGDDTTDLSGDTTEKTSAGADDASSGTSDEEQKTITVAEHTRTVSSRKKSRHEDLYKDLPIEYVNIDIPEDQLLCPECLNPTTMEHLGYEFVREELVIQEAVVKRIRYMRQKVVCPVCRSEGEFTVKSAPVPTCLISHSCASASIVSHIMYNKTLLCLPYYRQEDDWKLKGVPLSRGTMARWYITCALTYFLPLYVRLHEELVKRDLIHCDEVPAQVLQEEGKSPQSRSYIWVYLTGNDGKPCIKLYDYKPGRKGAYAREFLEGFSGMIHCDGYSVYGTIPDVVRLVCLSHCRRKFYEAIPKKRRNASMLADINSEKSVKDTAEELKEDNFMWPGEKGVAFCNRLFYLERLYKDLPAEERQKKRLESESQVWEEFWSWIEKLDPTGGSKLETAVNYAKNYKTELMNYLKDGRCEISNNSAERACKRYVMMRKNSLFHATEDGADATAIVMSLIETARANNLNPQQYLYYLLLYMPDYVEKSEGIEKLLPWSEFIQKNCSGKTDMTTVTQLNKGKLIP